MPEQGFPPSRAMLLLGGLALVSVTLFMLSGAGASWSFVLPFRAAKVGVMVVVGFAIAASTVLFQTVTGNRILTPGIMGFDALYALIQTVLVFALGSGAVAALDPRLLFGAEVAVMIGMSALLYALLFAGGRRDLHLLVLAGVVIGILFRSLTDFAGRVIAPNEYAFLQDRFFASFNNPDRGMLGLSAVALVAACMVGWQRLARWDVLALGRDTAINLGVDHRHETRVILALVAVLVSVSTALVGPVTFFGLLVANLAYALVRSHCHALLIPAAALIALICLATGQFVLERLFGFDGSLKVVIEFAGGIAFILVLIRGAAR